RPGLVGVGDVGVRPARVVAVAGRLALRPVVGTVRAGVPLRGAPLAVGALVVGGLLCGAGCDLPGVLARAGLLVGQIARDGRAVLTRSFEAMVGHRALPPYGLVAASTVRSVRGRAPVRVPPRRPAKPQRVARSRSAACQAGGRGPESGSGRRPPRAKKSASGRIAAPTVTASGPRLPSSIVTFWAGWRSAYDRACRRRAGRKRGPSRSPAQPPMRMRSGWNRLIRSDSPAPRYSAVSSSTASATGSATPPSGGWAAASIASS